jgi:hypothetical protein
LDVADTGTVGAHRQERGSGPERNEAARTAGVVDKRDFGVQFQPIGHAAADCHGGRCDFLLEPSDKDVPKSDARNDLEAVNPQVVLRPVVLFDRRIDDDLALRRQHATDARQCRSGFDHLSGLLLLGRRTGKSAPIRPPPTAAARPGYCSPVLAARRKAAKGRSERLPVLLTGPEVD